MTERRFLALALFVASGCVPAGYHKREMAKVEARRAECQEKLYQEIRTNDDKKSIERERPQPTVEESIEWQKLK